MKEKKRTRGVAFRPHSTKEDVELTAQASDLLRRNLHSYRACMSTNGQVRARLALKRDGPAPGLIQRMMQRNDQESADSATAAAEAKESESTSSAVEDQESASACAAEDATRHEDGGSSEEEGRFAPRTVGPLKTGKRSTRAASSASS